MTQKLAKRVKYSLPMQTGADHGAAQEKGDGLPYYLTLKRSAGLLKIFAE